MINSNLIDTLRKDALDVAIVYSGNPCQLAIAHVLAVPIIYYDLEGTFSFDTTLFIGDSSRSDSLVRATALRVGFLVAEAFPPISSFLISNHYEM